MPFEIVEKLVTICGKEFPNPSPHKTMVTACKHPRVRIVSRQEDTEYVECLECGDVFDSEEFHDMEIEETAEKEEEIEDE
jgi:DNA-directed RNA polymerase subunit RPC12/RpoP